MDSLGPWKGIKVGFWIGIGFIIPSVAAYVLGSQALFAMPALWQSDAAETMGQFMEETNRTSRIKVLEFRESSDSNRLLLLGVIENTGEGSVGSIRLEAELFNDGDEMVFECSEYISKRLESGEKENFQIKCGCGNEVIPEHSSVTVRVVSANSY
jgi:hypothetical protein